MNCPRKKPILTPEQASREKEWKRKWWAKNGRKYLDKRKTDLAYRARDRERVKQSRKDPVGKLKHYVRNRLTKAIRRAAATKCGRSMDLVGCTPQELRRHIEGKFKRGMSWANYGKWHVDHIIPCAKFDLVLPDQQRACFHFTNLQPLWKFDNLSKSDAIKSPAQMSLLI